MSKYLNFNCMGEVVKIPHDSAIIEKSLFMVSAMRYKETLYRKQYWGYRNGFYI